MRKSLFLSAFLVLGFATIASAHDDWRRHQHNGPHVFVAPPQYVYPAPRYRYAPPQEYYGPPPGYYAPPDYYEDERPRVGVCAPNGGPCIQFGF